VSNGGYGTNGQVLKTTGSSLDVNELFI